MTIFNKVIGSATRIAQNHLIPAMSGSVLGAGRGVAKGIHNTARRIGSYAGTYIPQSVAGELKKGIVKGYADTYMTGDRLTRIGRFARRDAAGGGNQVDFLKKMGGFANRFGQKQTAQLYNKAQYAAGYGAMGGAVGAGMWALSGDEPNFQPINPHVNQNRHLA